MNVDPLPRALCIMGIDPGLSGAIAWYFPDDPHLITAEDMPVVDKNIDAATLARRVKQMNPDVAVLEQAWPRQLDGKAQCFKSGVGYGVVQGVIASCGVPVSIVSPQRWKKHFRLTSDKEQCRGAAIKLWPASEHFERKKDADRAEAALLARYGAEMILRVGGWAAA